LDNCQKPNSPKHSQNNKTLIAKEMPNQSAPTLASCVHVPLGEGVSNGRKAIEASARNSPGEDANSPLTYCTIGNDPLQGALDVSLNEKTIGARSFRVLHFKLPQEIQGCQVLFIGAEVGESEHFVGGGGMSGFLLEENKIRLEINPEAAKKAKLKITSKLLVLAKTVIGRQGGT
jgi:hypothetical protein